MCEYKDFDFNTTKDDLLLAVDVSNEFITGVLGSKHAATIIPGIVDFWKNFQGQKGCTMDTHSPDYMSTQEGRLLPILHGQRGTPGWQLVKPLGTQVTDQDVKFEKDTFGSKDLFEYIKSHKFKHIYFCGAKTGICVIANAILAKTADPEAEICILSKLCTCITKESHETAIRAMDLLQMKIL